MLKRLTALTMHNPAFARFVDLLEQVDDRRPDFLRVLTYHRVSEPHAVPYLFPSLAVSPADFAQHMSYLRDRYTPISIPEVLHAFQNGHALPPGAILVTFDDAYCDFEVHAWPVLEHLDIPCVLFVATAFPDHPDNTFWWDRLYAAFLLTPRQDVLATPVGRFPLAEPAQRKRAFTRLHDHIKSLPHRQAMTLVEEMSRALEAPEPGPSVLSWNSLRRLAREGVVLGAHSQTHPLFNQISLEEVRTEVVGSLRDLKREVGSTLPVFAYPGGELTDQVTRILAEEGILLGFTTRRGINDLKRVNHLRLQRINVGSRTSFAALRVQLLTRSAGLFR